MKVYPAGGFNAGDSRWECVSLLGALLEVVDGMRVRLSEFLARYDLSEGRFSILGTLRNQGGEGMSQADLADSLGQSESNISSHIDRLQRDGLVDRTWSPHDRRKRVLLLTPGGQVFADEVIEAHRVWAESVAGILTARERTALVSALQRLAGPLVPRATLRLLNPPRDAQRPSSPPQLALQQMLSDLGLARRIAGEQQ